MWVCIWRVTNPCSTKNNEGASLYRTMRKGLRRKGPVKLTARKQRKAGTNALGQVKSGAKDESPKRPVRLLTGEGEGGEMRLESTGRL